ncbi:efflux RND transporter permease subunit [candidate division KSB1 bacterium]|nr:efflux RND transporter permease subunit [candidate division KSB1 bacterium]
MLNYIIEWVIRYRWPVLAMGGFLAIAGLISLSQLPFDAMPDITPAMVQVNTSIPGYAPEDVESQVTMSIERELSGLAGLTEIRSISKFGLSQVTCVFAEGTDVYRARQQVSERLSTVELPEGIERPRLGPISTGLGEIFHYIVIGKSGDATAAREAQDWLLKPQLQAVPGVVEVNSWGGFEKQYQVLLDPARLAAFRLTVADVVEALRRGHQNVGGGVTTRAGEQFVVQGVGALTKREDIERIVVDTRDGTPIHVDDIGDVVIGHALRMAAVTYNGQGEAVLGLGFMLTGENPQRVARDLEQQLRAAIETLPPGVEAHVVYERSQLVDQVLDTVQHNLFYGAALVIAVLFLFLGNIRASILVALSIPLSMLFAFSLMLQTSIAGSLMSLGAIDFGLAVDNSVIQVENVMRRLGHHSEQRSRLQVIKDAILEVRKPTMFGELIIMLVYLPVLTLQGVEGRLFQPMALTVIFVLAGSLLLSFTVVPALCALFLPATAKEREPKIVDFLRGLYQPVLNWALRHAKPVLTVAVLLVVVAAVVFMRLGSEFVPRLSEGSVVVNLIRLAGVSLDQSRENGERVEAILQEKFPDEVAEVWTRTGTPELATDPMGVELSDVFVSLKPRKEWTRADHQQQLVALMDEELSDLPGMNLVFTQPIEMRFNELVAGIRTDIGIKIFGDDLDVLKEKALQIEQIVKETDGAADVTTEQISGQPVLRIEVDAEALSRYSLSSADVLEAVQTLGGTPVGEVREGQRRFELVARMDEAFTRTPEAMDGILLPAPEGELVPLLQVTRLRQTEGPSTISREWGKRRVVVQCNVRGRDVGTFIDELRARIDKEVSFEAGYYVRYGGQFENLERARARLMIVVPLALLLIFGLLYWTYKSVRDALLIFSGVPLAAVGGVLALAVRQMPFTISAGVGFIALSGIAVLNGLVLVSSIRQLQQEGRSLADAIRTSGSLRMRPVIMTALVAALGFVPMAFSNSVGSEVQRPLATVVIGGILTSTLLTLIVLPVLYKLAGRPLPQGENQAKSTM